jgi:hypothetical protein
MPPLRPSPTVVRDYRRLCCGAWPGGCTPFLDQRTHGTRGGGRGGLGDHARINHRHPTASFYASSGHATYPAGDNHTFPALDLYRPTSAILRT